MMMMHLILIRSLGLRKSLFKSERENNEEKWFVDVLGIIRDGRAVLESGFQGILSTNVHIFYIHIISLFWSVLYYFPHYIDN